MKKSLLLAALALFGAAAPANAALNIEEGKPYVLRYGTSDFYFNMEKDGLGDGYSRHNASLSANATTVYFHENPATPGQWAICYSAEDASKCLGVGGQNGVDGANWNAVINCTDPFYWSLTESSTAASGNPIVHIHKANNTAEYLAVNIGETPNEERAVYANKNSSDAATLDWELIPVAMPDGINLDPTKAYLMSLKGHDGLNLQMVTPKAGTSLVTISESIVAPVRVVPKHDGTVAIVCCQTGLFLGYSQWNSIYNSAAAAGWTMSATGDNGETSYTLHQDGSDAGYLGRRDDGCIDGAEIWTNVANNSGELINWKFTEMAMTPVALTVNFLIDGVTPYSSTVISGFEGGSYTIEYPPFTTGDPLTGTFNSIVTSIDVPVQVSVPFKYTATTDNMIWQGVTVHSNNDWFLKYTEDGSTTLVDNNSNRKNLNSPFADSELWAFVGNLTDGFKIYNKAAGLEKTLYRDGDNAKVGAATENNQWKPMVSAAISNTSEACGFNIDNSNPMNAQNGALVFSWALVDAGSTWEFYSLAEPMINFYNQKGLDTTPKLGCVGDLLPDTDLTAVDAAKAAAEEDPYNSEKAQALHEALNTVMESIVYFDPAKWYRLENFANRGTYLVANSTNTNFSGVNNGSERTNHFSIVKFEAVPEQTDRYYIADQGLYFGHVTGNATKGDAVTQVEATGERGEFTIATMGTAKHVFRDAASNSAENRTYLHYSTAQGIVGWGPYANPSQWYIHPANDLDMTLTMQFDGKYIGTGYFPFPVKASDSAKLYYVTESKSKTDNTPVMTYNEVSSVPASTAFVVMSESATATIAIDYDGLSAQAEPENKLAGTYRAASATAGDYVFNGIAFEKSTDAPAIGSNSAYIPQSAVSDATITNYPLVSPDQTVGINEIGVATSGKQVIYDLQGRRVQRATKGLYIINGVKTLVK